MVKSVVSNSVTNEDLVELIKRLNEDGRLWLTGDYSCNASLPFEASTVLQGLLTERLSYNEQIKSLNQCIAELYKLLDTITENVLNHDLSLLRVKGGIGGTSIYQGLPPICKKRDDILDKYDQIIYNALEENKDIER